MMLKSMPGKYKPRLVWKRHHFVPRVWSALELGARTVREVRGVEPDLTSMQVSKSLSWLVEKCRVRIVRQMRGVDCGRINVYEICR